MKKFKFLFLSVLFFLPLSSQAASDSCFYYFYGDGCSHCAQTSPVIDMMINKYPNIEVHKFEVWSNQDNGDLFDQFIDKYNISPAGVPTLIMADKYYIGSKPIIDNMETYIKTGPSLGCPSVQMVVANPPSMNSGNNSGEAKAAEQVQPKQEGDKTELNSNEQSNSAGDNWERLPTESINSAGFSVGQLPAYIAIGGIVIVLLWLAFKKK